MSVNYTRINWEDSPSTQTPINAENLNAMDSAIDDLAGAVNDLDGVTEDVEELQTNVAGLKNDLTQGTFPVGNAENADQLTSTVGIEDKTPYLFRTSGGSVDIGDRETVGKIVGGTIVNNQLFNFPQQNTSNGVTLTFENGVVNLSGTATSGYCSFFTARITGGHKILVDTKVVSNPDNLTIIFGSLNGQGRATIGSSSITNAINLAYASGIGIEGYGGTGTVFNNVKFQCVCTDLTLALGTSIANYVYNLETATAGAGIAWLKKHFPKQFNSGYQAYDAGSMQSVSGLTEHKMVGFNQWDEQWEAGLISVTTGQNVNGTGIRSKNMNRCVPGTSYYYKAPGNSKYVMWYDVDENFISPSYIESNGVVTSPSNAAYFRLRVDGITTYSNDICINLHWDGERDGEYEPYQEWVYSLDSSLTLRGIPKVDANGNLYYDGDEYLPDGTVNRRYGVVDLGTLSWGYNSNYQNPFMLASITGAKNNTLNLINAKGYVPKNDLIDVILNDKSVVITSGTVRIRDDAYTDAAAFKTAMSGVYLVYELAESTTETADPYQEVQICNDWGTEEYVLADGVFPVPVGHDTMYQNNLRAKLEMSPDSPDGDGLYVVQQESGENTYVPLASTATIQDILTRLTALENA